MSARVQNIQMVEGQTNTYINTPEYMHIVRALSARILRIT